MRSISGMVCLLTLAIAGCVTERVVWSPDGTRAAVVGDDGLHMCDVSGKLSPVLAADVKCVDWLPDSKHLVVCRQRELKNWKEASEAFEDDWAAGCTYEDRVRLGLQDATHGWPIFIEEMKKKYNLSDVQLALVLMFLRDRPPQERPDQNLDKQGKEAFASMSILDVQIQMYSVGESSATPGTLLYHHPIVGKGIQSLRVSPRGQVVLASLDVSVIKDETEPPQLLLASADASEKIRNLGRGAAYPDWSPDGRYAIYIRPAGWNESQKDAALGILTRQEVASADGKLLDQMPLPNGEDLAGLLFNELSRVRVANDGRIFFSAAEISLPAAVKDIDTQATIYCFDPGKQATLTRVVPRSAMQATGNAAQYFELSPDARYLSVPFDDGRVSVLDIASGEAHLVQPVAEPDDKDHARLTTIPVWRTSTELTFVRPAPSSTGHEVVRYTVPDKSATVISADWPASVGKWLAAKQAGAAEAAGASAEKK